VGQEMTQLFCPNFIKSSPNLLIFGIQNYVKYTYFPPHRISVNALPCKMQMLLMVTLRSDYQYQIAHLFIISSTESAT